MRAGSRHGLAVIVIGLAAAALAPGAGAATLGQLSYDGCVSNDGSGGLCADAPGSPLTGALGVAVSPDGKSVYVVGPGASTITHFFAAPQGQITYDGCVSNDGSGGLCAVAPSLKGAFGVAVSPDGKSVYVGSEGAITHFFAAPQGQITYDGCVTADGSGGVCAAAPGFSGAFGVAVSPDGKSVYAASPGGEAIAHFFAAPQGQITYDGCVSDDGSGGSCAVAPGAPLKGAIGVAVSPDGKSVYVASISASTISHFFAAPQGQITYDGCVSDDGSGGLCADAPGAPLSGALGVAVSPDGKSVYVTSTGGNASTVAHFFAAPQGQITYDSCVSNDGSGGLCANAPPLEGAFGVAVSPDGKSVYVAGFSAGAITNFSAAPQGRLTFSGCVSDDGSGGQCTDLPGTPLTQAAGVAVSPDGTSVYATAETSGDVVHFFRQATSGGGGGGGTHGPSLSKLTISPHRFRAGATGGAIVKGGEATISFRLDVAATVTFTVREMVSGRRQRIGTHVRCVAVTHQNRNANHCTRAVTLGAFSVAGASGLNRVHFSGRLGGRKLPAGATFTLVAVPTAARRSGASSSVSFVIKR